MIKFHSVKYKNFLSSGNAFTEIQLDRSKSTLVVGKNGSGKSTMLDALSYSLYKKPFRKINMPQLINSINAKDCLVECEFSIGGAEYLIRRGMRPNILELYKNDNLVNQDANARDYQQHIEKNILKMSHHAFCQVVVLGSATYTPFMQLPAWQRREVVEDLLDIQVFSTMNALRKERSSKNKEAQQQVRYDIDLTKERIEMQKQMLASRSEDVAERTKIHKNRCHEVTSHLGELNKTKLEVNTQVDNLKISIEAKKDRPERLNQMRNIMERLIEKTRAIEKEIGFYHDSSTCPKCRQAIDDEFRQKEIASGSEQLSVIVENKPKLEAMYEAATQDVAELKAAQKDLQSRLAELSRVNADIRSGEKRLEELKDELKKLGSKTETNSSNDDTKLRQHVEELRVFEAQKESLASDGVILAAAELLLKDGGIKANIIKQYIPIMNKLINKYLAALDFFVQFEMDEQFNEKIKSRFRDEFSYQSFSEGEKFKINLAILFTWRAIAKLRNSASTNLLIMDEVFDSSLDSNGTEEFLKVIGDLTADTNLFVISHKGDVLVDKFHSLIEFEKHGNYSVMK